MRTPENTHFTTFVNKGKKRKGRSCYTPTPSLGRSLLSQPSLMVQQNEERLRKGDGWQDNDLVFPNTLGKPMNAGNFYRRDFQPLLERAGLADEGFTFHSLRHTFATTLAAKGVHPSTAQKMLG